MKNKKYKKNNNVRIRMYCALETLVGELLCLYAH